MSELSDHEEAVQETADRATAPQTTGSPAEPEVTSDFECAVCMKLLLDPISVSCGHTFCKLCIEKSLDYRSNCPLCRRPIAASSSVNVLISTVISEKYPKQLEARLQERKAEIESNEVEVQEERRRRVANTSHLPIIRRKDWCHVQAHHEMYFSTPQELAMMNHILHGNRQFALFPSDPSHKIGNCVEIDHVARGAHPNAPCLVRLSGKHRLQFVESSLGDGGFEIANCEAVMDGTLDTNELLPGEDTALAIAHYCKEQVEAQLPMIGQSGKRMFEDQFGRIRTLGGTVSSVDLENFSLWLCSVIIVSDAQRQVLFASKDTKARLEAIRQILSDSRGRLILNMSGTNSFMNPTSVGGTLLMFAAIIIMLIVKHKKWFNRQGGDYWDDDDGF